jgi:hypothetical protein
VLKAVASSTRSTIASTPAGARLGRCATAHPLQPPSSPGSVLSQYRGNLSQTFPKSPKSPRRTRSPPRAPVQRNGPFSRAALQILKWSGREDLNLRLLGPETASDSGARRANCTGLCAPPLGLVGSRRAPKGRVEPGSFPKVSQPAQPPAWHGLSPSEGAGAREPDCRDHRCCEPVRPPMCR